jgi:hypothetical protein
MWISFPIGRRARMGVPLWLAVLAFPFVVVGVAAYVLLVMVAYALAAVCAGTWMLTTAAWKHRA